MEDNKQTLVKQLQQAQLDILIELDRVCSELNVQYCLAFGTSLGAVRHKGFIPWDDDIDVYMTIEDLELLQKNDKLFKNDYFLQYSESDPEYGLMITRLRNSNTTLIEENEKDRDINHGIFIDIYPLFKTPRGGFGAKKLVFASRIYRLMLYKKVPVNRGKIMRIGATILLKVLPRRSRRGVLKSCYNVMKSNHETGYITTLYGDEEKIKYRENAFFPVQWVDFENIKAPIQADPDYYLKKTYGNYMELPPVEKQQFHHSYACIDFENSYTKYRGKKYGKENKR